MIEPKTTFSGIRPLVEYIKKYRDNQKFIKSIEISATLILVTFFLLVAIRPTIFTISSLIGEIKAKEVLTKEIRKKINQIVYAQDVFSQVQERYLIVNSALPDSEYYSQIASELAVSADSVGLPIETINFNLSAGVEDKNKKNLDSYQISIAAKSDFPSMIRLIDKISSGRRLTSFKSVSFSTNIGKTGTSESTPSSQLNTILSTNVLYWNQNE